MIRRIILSFIRKYRWAPSCVAAVFMVAFAASSYRRDSRPIVVLSGIAFAAACYVWGYSVRALKFATLPSLDHLHRRQYTETWDALASSPSQARATVCGNSNEGKLRFSAQRPVTNITELVGIKATDNVLEIGCGVARIGLELAPRCQQWTGADISKNMLACAADRLVSLNNVHLVHLTAANLDAFPANSFDLAYSTGVFDHLDQMDRYKYILDAFRVLSRAGRLYVDNTDMESDAGWAGFAHGVAIAQAYERSPFQPSPITAAELTAYAKRAGFVEVRTHHRSPLIILTAIKPGVDQSFDRNSKFAGA
ncbi:MAG: methyltransferase domain-containing protein [Candidatus Sulfotelmatobacter sp.]